MEDFGAVDARPPASPPPPSVNAPAEPDTSAQVPVARTETGHSRRLATLERAFQAALQRKRLLSLAGGAALIGALFFWLTLWKLSWNKPAPRQDTPVKLVDGALKKYLEADDPAHAFSAPPGPAPANRAATPLKGGAPSIAWDAPPARTAAGFVTITSDVTANVYVDGLRLKKQTPVKAYPVLPGNRRITLESAATLERRTFTLNVVRGQSRQWQEIFGKPPVHR